MAQMVVYELLMDESIFCVCQKLNDDVNQSEKLFSFWRLFDTLTKQWKMGKMRHWIQMQFLMHLENLVILEMNTFDMLRIGCHWKFYTINKVPLK